MEQVEKINSETPNSNSHLLMRFDQDLNNSKRINIQLTKKVKNYENSEKNECINEFEILEYISRGLIWKVFKCRRYYFGEKEEIQTSIYALKKSHIRTLTRMRYYENDEQKNFMEKIVNEISIHNKLYNEEYIARLYEVLYDPSVEIDYNLNNQYIYYIMEYCDLGPLMIKNFDDCKYYHNHEILRLLAKFVFTDFQYIFEKENFVTKETQSQTESCVTAFIKEKPNQFSYKFIKKCCAILFIEVTKGLNILHQNLVVYNDLKPENICCKINPIKKEKQIENTSEIKNEQMHLECDVLCKETCGLNLPFKVKLLDFSISNEIEENNKNFMISYCTGTIHFQAPEIMLSKADGRLCDIWSLGVCIYVFLSGEFPFNGEGELEIQVKTMNGKFVYPDFFDEQVKELLDKILIKDPLKRINSFEKIIEILKSWI